MLQLLYYVRRLDRLRGFTPAKRERNKHWAGIARVFGFGICVSVGVGAFAAQSAASTELNEVSMGVGQELSSLSDLIQKPHSITINGEHFFVGSGDTAESLGTVLDRFESHCRANTTVDGETWSKLEDIANKNGATGTPFSVVRRQQEHEGMVMCIVKTEATQGRPVLQSIGLFTKTHNVGALGALRYAYVHEGADHKSHILTAWTNKSFSLDALVPPDGNEAPGTDSELAPRPPGQTQRLLSANLDGTPYAVRVYQSTSTPEQVYQHYDTEMTKQGWSPLVSKSAPNGRGYLKGGVLVSIAASKDPNGGSSVSVGDLGGGTVGVDDLAAPKVEAH